MKSRWLLLLVFVVTAGVARVSESKVSCFELFPRDDYSRWGDQDLQGVWRKVVGQRVRKLIERRRDQTGNKYTMEQVAELIRISPASLYKIQNGQQSMRVHHAYSLGEKMNVDYRWLLAQDMLNFYYVRHPEVLAKYDDPRTYWAFYEALDFLVWDVDKTPISPKKVSAIHRKLRIPQKRFEDDWYINDI